jgi:hypothetical protein
VTNDTTTFLDLIDPLFGDEMLNLCAIDPKTERIVGEVFRANDRSGQIRFIDQHRAKNLYYGLNPLALTPSKGKAKKTDVGHLTILGVDFDPRSVETRDEDLQTYRTALSEFPLQPSALIDSGRGLQALWILAAVQVNDNLHDLERYTTALCRHFGADHTQDICRLFRLPGTTNFPNKTKQRDGWTTSRPTRLIEASGRRYQLEDFTFVVTAANATAAEHVPKVRADANGAGTKGDRSRDLLRQVGKDRRGGQTREQIHKEHDSHPHAADQANPARAVDACINKVDADETRLIESINREHALILLDGKLFIMWQREWAHGLPQLSTVEDIRRIWLPKKIGKVNPIDVWMEHSDRAYYSGIVFEPGVTDTGSKLNLFRGWATEPRKGDCALILSHLRDECCDGDDALYEYVIQWFANLFQFPRDKSGTLLTMGSEEGAGKGALARYFKCMLGHHLVQLGSSEQLLGRFNDFLATALLVFGDEVVWGGDKKGADKLKAYITEDHIFIERKFVPGLTIRNYARFITATNHEHSAPAGTSARRYVVLPMNERRIGDHTYWTALEAERRGDGPSALLYYLLHEVQVTRNLRDVPKTAALAQQKLLSLDSMGEFWRAMLMTREHYLEEGYGSKKEVIAEWRFGDVVLTTTLHDFYLKFQHNRRGNFSESIDKLGKGLRRYLPLLPKREATTDEKKQFGIEKATRTQVYDMPPLREAREQFEKVLGSKLEWADVTVDENGVEYEPTFALNGNPTPC